MSRKALFRANNTFLGQYLKALDFIDQLVIKII